MRRASRWALAVAVAAAAAAVWIKYDDRVVFLFPSHGADWIRAGDEAVLTERPSGGDAVFRVRFEVLRAAPSAVVTLRALRTAELRLDGRPSGPPIGLGRRAWKNPARVELGPLKAGEHELEIAVVNPAGPAAAEAYSSDLPVASGESWEVRVGSSSWARARRVERDWDVPLSRRFPRGDRALLRALPALAPLFCLVFAAALAWDRGALPARIERCVPSPAALRWTLLLSWAALGLNNIRRIPVYVGFDVMAHLRYLQTIALEHRLPAAAEGWQTFQAPLYYLMSAPLWNCLSSLLGHRLARFWIRLLPLSCGAFQVEASYRCARSVFSDRPDLQRLTILVAGLMPMNLYISQAAGNEPLAGCLSAALIAMALSFRPGPRERRSLALLGATLGLALLAKASAFLLAAPVLTLVGVRLAGRDRAAGGPAARGLSLVAGVAAAVCGWYYLENLIRFGSPIPNMFSADQSWWQTPGYRTVGQLTRFGQALVWPVYSGANGFWDSIYSTMWMDGYLSGLADPVVFPPWNFSFMIASALLALIPALGIVCGLLRLCAARTGSDEGLRFAGGCVVLYAAAILFVYLRLPVYSAAKASYMLGVTPCLGLLAASGVDALSSRRTAVRAALYAAVACWAAAVYAAYFVLSPIVAVAAG